MNGIADPTLRAPTEALNNSAWDNSYSNLKFSFHNILVIRGEKGAVVLRFGLLSGALCAITPMIGLAQNAMDRVATPAPSIEATADPYGKIVPLKDNGAGPERIGEGEPAKPVSPCPDVKAMTPEAARALVRTVATREDFYPDFVVAVAKVESGFNATAVSGTGAFGLMQLEAATAARFKVNLCDPSDNVLGGVRFLRDLHDHYKNPLFILSAYNAGEDTLLRYRGVPPYPETVTFVTNVLNEFYDWPAATARQPSGARLPVAGTVAPVHGNTRNAALSRALRNSSTDGWSEGFVKHLD